MSEVKEITVNVSKKIGMKNYSSDMISASATVSVDKDDFKTAFKKGWDVCWGEIESQMVKYQEPEVPKPTKVTYAPNPDAGVVEEPDWLKNGVKI